MKCGAKCFLVEIERQDKIETIPVNARTQAAARKVIRQTFGEHTHILSAKIEKRN